MTKPKHCPSCTCDGFVVTPERARKQKLFSGVPETGCADYRAGRYCGKPIVEGLLYDRCKEHNHR